MVRIELSGRVGSGVDIDTEYIRKSIEDGYFHVKVVDGTKPFINYDEFMLDMSLRGEFVRLIKAKQEQGLLDADIAAKITRMGIDVLAGEEGAL